ncbi:PAS domain-containing protein [Anseongella ginsenosidimutans]|uniref:histidine kinase n=1 Tax=Anseongella ginsenosidimutans TaxID=496056 RepID=A0A4R3KWJ2_9SPHI|nr:ATP-binding protein [Anseongella ginsenosidimutans]TCS90157.1 PAS domain-containing protein [Anseongella ginsenosidimutans]
MKTSRFARLGTWYLLALGTIALMIIAGLVLIQQYLSSQLNDSGRVNIAGRQRMLCQQIAKNAALLENRPGNAERTRVLDELATAVEDFRDSREKLTGHDDSLGAPREASPRLAELYRANGQHYRLMLQGGLDLLRQLRQDSAAPYDSLASPIRLIQEQEAAFLEGMDQIVQQYDLEARQKVKRLKRAVFILLGVSLLLIFLETVFVFLPSAREVNKTLGKSMASEKNARKMAKEIGALYSSLERSYEKISHINVPVDNPKLYAKADRGGNITYVSETFSRLTGRKKQAGNFSVAGLLGLEKQPGDFMDELIDTVSEGKTWQDEIHLEEAAGAGKWLRISIVPIFDETGTVHEMLILGSDLTRQRLAEQGMQKKDRAAIERRINEQKFRSVLILEGQEEERKRIAMNIHDGIGQLITSLKYQIESLDASDPAAAREKQKEINNLLKEIIREVRRVTFNLKPPVLSDYGLSAGLKNFMQEVNKLTEAELEFRNLTGFGQRMPSKVENNIFRIVQEAVNNAIKYSGSKHILVSLSHDENQLTITVEDQGHGFDKKLLETEKYRIESGHGFFNMFERTEYINGKLQIATEPGKGTIVRLFVPLGKFEEIADL